MASLSWLSQRTSVGSCSGLKWLVEPTCSYGYPSFRTNLTCLSQFPGLVKNLNLTRCVSIVTYRLHVNYSHGKKHLYQPTTGLYSIGFFLTRFLTDSLPALVKKNILIVLSLAHLWLLLVVGWTSSASCEFTVSRAASQLKMWEWRHHLASSGTSVCD